MRAQSVIDQSNIRTGDSCQQRQLAKMVHAHFNDGITMFFVQFQQSQRQADMVVEIAGSRQHSFITESMTQYAGQHLFNRRFAGRAGNTEDKRIHIFTPRLRQFLQSRKRIVNLQRAFQSRTIFVRNQNCRCPRCQHIFNKVMSVKTLTGKREKYIAFLNITAVGYDARNGLIFRRHRKAERLADEI